MQKLQYGSARKMESAIAVPTGIFPLAIYFRPIAVFTLQTFAAFLKSTSSQFRDTNHGANIMRTTKSRAKNAAVTKPAKAAKPAAVPVAPAAEAAKPEAKRPLHNIKLSYAGPSPTVRQHGRKLSAIRTDLGAGRITERDETFMRDLRTAYGTRTFKRFDADAGCVRRAIAHGFLTHVSGDLGSRDAEFKLTARAHSYK
jgi:hypothetical protein